MEAKVVKPLLEYDGVCRKARVCASSGTVSVYKLFESHNIGFPALLAQICTLPFLLEEIIMSCHSLNGPSDWTSTKSGFHCMWSQAPSPHTPSPKEI